MLANMRLDARQTVRIPVRAPAHLAYSAGRLQVVAEDFTPGGCGLVSPLAFRRGQPVYLILQIPGGPQFATHATVAWASGAAPHRTGLAFGPDSSPERERNLRTLIEVLTTRARTLPALRPQTWVRALRSADLQVSTREEREVLSAALEGATVRDLLSRTGGPGARRALLALRHRGFLAEGVGPSRPPARAAAPPDPPALDLAPAFPAPPARPRRAAACLEMARGERAAGHLPAAAEWLLAAAEEAPDDPEIGAELDAITLVMGC